MRTSQYAQVRAVRRPDRDGSRGVRGTEWTCPEAIAMSENGTFPTCRGGLMTSVIRGRPEVAGRGQNGAFDP